MKAVVLVALLVAASSAASAMPHDFASQKLRLAVPTTTATNHRFMTGAPVTFESFGRSNTTDLECKGVPELAVKLHVGECKDVTSSLAINITDWVQPPIHNKEPEGMCASMVHYGGTDCSGEHSAITFEVKKCQSGDFWGDWQEATKEMLTIHSGCDAPATDVYCKACNATTHAEFDKCTEIPRLHGSVKVLRVERCNPVRLNFLTSCSSGKVYSSYLLAQDRCFDGYKIKDGHV